MNRVAKFYKISFEQFLSDYISTYKFLSEDPQDNINRVKDIYNNIVLPKRGTINSAGYDFVTPIDFELEPGKEIKILTGIRCQFNSDWVLNIYPRSGIGFKYHVVLANTTGIIDSDYVSASNEGHIILKLVNMGDKTFSAKAGDRIVQGIFLTYGITIDDDADGERIGGFGSTGR